MLMELISAAHSPIYSCRYPNFIETYPDLVPQQAPNTYIPRIFGFKIYKKKGSKYHEQKKGLTLTYFGEDKEKEKKEQDEKLNLSHSDNNRGSN